MSKKILDDQNKFVKDVTNQIVNVLNNCNSNQADCICSIRVRYLSDRTDLPEHKRYMTEVFCDEKGTTFHKNISKELDRKRKNI